jgi:hypothetical protein
VGNLAAGAATTLHITVRAQSLGAKVNSASVDGDQPDQNGANDSDSATTTVVPGEPATLALSPKTATNPVDTQHCVTATVKDAFGDPTPGEHAVFSVSGAASASGTRTTAADGTAQFCYQGPGLPGVDAITAYADTNDSHSRDAGEPQDTAAKTWVLPASTEGCKVTGGGTITAANGDRASFGGNAQVKKGVKGEETYSDPGPATSAKVKSLEIQAVACSADGTRASVFGRASVNGSGSYDVRIDLTDNGEPGRDDRYRIRLSNGYDSGEQTLDGGNVQLH